MSAPGWQVSVISVDLGFGGPSFVRPRSLQVHIFLVIYLGVWVWFPRLKLLCRRVSGYVWCCYCFLF